MAGLANSATIAVREVTVHAQPSNRQNDGSDTYCDRSQLHSRRIRAMASRPPLVKARLTDFKEGDGAIKRVIGAWNVFLAEPMHPIGSHSFCQRARSTI